MRVLARQKQRPISVRPGDAIQLTYTDPCGKVTQLKAHTFDNYRVFDDFAVVELDKPELDKLGMKSAIAGVFGERG